jgi:CBS domain-containing protein
MTPGATIQSLLEIKGRDVYSIAPDASVYHAIAMMSEKEVGALLVMRDGVLTGIISERDYMRKVILQGRSSKQTEVSEIMTSPVITAPSHATVEECMRTMTARRIRHLPVLRGSTVIGVVSIGDLVKAIISAQEQEISHLHHFIAAGYPG